MHDNNFKKAQRYGCGFVPSLALIEHTEVTNRSALGYDVSCMSLRDKQRMSSNDYS